MSAPPLDQDAVNRFAMKVLQDWGGAHIAALAYIGDRLGIFGALAERGPMTVRSLADATALNERYLREWAAAMAAAEYVEYAPEDQTFWITPEHAAVLAREGHPSFLGGGFQYAQACAQRVPELMQAFRSGGGVSFAEFGPEISEAIERLFAPVYARCVATEWIPAAGPVYHRVLEGAEVAEVGCGGGQALVPMAEAFPASRFTGYDVDDTSIHRARERAVRAGVEDRAAFELRPAEEIPHRDHFDLVVAFNCVHDMGNPRGALAQICRALKDDGVLLWSEAPLSDRIEDNRTPLGRLAYGTSTMHCMTVSLAQDGEGLGNVIGVETARELAREAGFTHFERLDVENNWQQLFLARRGPA